MANDRALLSRAHACYDLTKTAGRVLWFLATWLEGPRLRIETLALATRFFPLPS